MRLREAARLPLVAALAGCAQVAPPEAALSPRLTAAQDWAVFAEESADGRICWIAAPPVRSETVGGADGRRSGVFLMTALTPETLSRPEVSYVGGWPLSGDGLAIEVGLERYAFFAQGPVAWIDDGLRELDLIESLRTGREAVARSMSAAGRRSTDLFSLLGYSAALEEAERLCA